VRRAAPAAAALLLALTAGACGEAASGDPANPARGAAAATGAVAPQPPQPPQPPEPAALGRTASTERVRFRPEQVALPGGQTAAVVSAITVGGELRVPDNIRDVGWWDGSAWAGDLFGGVVIAGHVDAPQQGLGYFARLLRLQPGDVVTLLANGHRARYRVMSVEAVFKNALSAASPPFDQRVGHRLVLMTCTGTFDRVTRSYDQNLVVIAEPLGPAV
jgi:hypothetical protein